MKQNTIDLVNAAIEGTAGIEIDYLTDRMIKNAIKPIEKILEFK